MVLYGDTMSKQISAATGAPAGKSGAKSAGKSDRVLTWPVISWGLWDWGSAAFNAVVTTFVFSVYLTSGSFGDEDSTSQALSIGMTIAGFAIALLAPVTGQRSDRSGKPRRMLGIFTAIVVALTACMYFIEPDPSYLWLGIIILGVANVFFSLCDVNYNGLLNSVSTPENRGRISGIGWGMGYLGGIVLLLVVYFGFINPEVTWLGIPNEDSMGIRLSMLVAAAWFGIFALPLFLSKNHKDSGTRSAQPKESFVASYKRLWHTLVALFRSNPHVVWFLLAAAIYRDGLAGVFQYGGVIAQGTFGFSSSDVILFAIASNVVAGISTILAGTLDDKIGPKRVIVGSLILLIASALAVFFFHAAGTIAFWILGLILSACVGPAQSASRSYLARIIPEGREGEIFGLYATTGRAVSFLAPLMFALSIGVGRLVLPEGANAQYWGILGIALVLTAGLALMAKVSSKAETMKLNDAS